MFRLVEYFNAIFTILSYYMMMLMMIESCQPFFNHSHIYRRIYEHEHEHSMYYIVHIHIPHSILRCCEFWLKLFIFAYAYTETSTTTTKISTARRQQNLFYASTHSRLDVNEDWERKIELNLIRSLDIHTQLYLPWIYQYILMSLPFTLFFCRSLTILVCARACLLSWW